MPETMQHTLAGTVGLTGVGLHSGEPVAIELAPAPVNHGIVFRRRLAHGASSLVAADWRQVSDTRLCTVLRAADGTEVGTVEHLLAALAALGVDNVQVTLDAAEVPILDGSARGWVELIDQVGLLRQPAARRFLRVLRPVRVEVGDSWAMLLPDAGSRYSVSIDFDDALIGRQLFHLRLDADAFRRDIAAARTFGFAADVARMQAAGRARGGSLGNAVLVSDGRVLNPDGLRHPDEFVRHKLLDCIGDLHLGGATLQGRLIAHRPGHAINHRLLQALFATPAACCFSQPLARAMPCAA